MEAHNRSEANPFIYRIYFEGEDVDDDIQLASIAGSKKYWFEFEWAPLSNSKIVNTNFSSIIDQHVVDLLLQQYTHSKFTRRLTVKN